MIWKSFFLLNMKYILHKYLRRNYKMTNYIIFLGDFDIYLKIIYYNVSQEKLF